MRKLITAIFAAAISSSAFAVTIEETSKVLFLGDAAVVKNAAEGFDTPVDIYEHVRNKYEFSPYHGARSNSLTTYFSKRGNDVDLASLLIAMYRSVGIPARYVEGVIRVKSDDVQAWLGVEKRSLVFFGMMTQGIVSTEAQTGGYVPDYDEVSDTFSFHHTWVEVLVPATNYRGLDMAGAGACSQEGGVCQWVALDPSFKKTAFNPQAISIEMDDVVESEAFFESLYSANTGNDPDYKNRNPLEIYENKILDYLEQNHPGTSMVDVVDNGHIVEDSSGLLPLSMPYEVVSVTRKFDDISDRDSAISSGEFPFEKTVSVSVTFNETGSVIIDEYTMPLSEVVDSRLVVTFENCVAGQCDVRLRKDGDIVHSVTFSDPALEVFDPITMEVRADHASPFYSATQAVYPSLKVGGVYAVAAGGYVSSWALVHRAVDRLLAAHDQYPTSISPSNVVYIDNNQNGVLDSGEELTGQPEALEAISGGFIDVALKLYFAKFYDAHKRLEGIHKVNMPIANFVGVTSTKVDVNYIDGSAFLVNPRGLLIDLKGMEFSGSWFRSKGATEQDAVYYNDHFELLAHIGSSLEHEIWQELTGFDAISTVRGFQWIKEDGGNIASMSDADPANLNRAECFKTANTILQLLDVVTANGQKVFANVPSTLIPNITWQELQDLVFNAVDPATGEKEIDLQQMVAFASNNAISMSSAVTWVPMCNGVNGPNSSSTKGTMTQLRDRTFENAKLFVQTGTLPPRENYNFGTVGETLCPYSFISCSVTNQIYQYFGSNQANTTYEAVMPAIANYLEGNLYSVYIKKSATTQTIFGPVTGEPLIGSIQMGLLDGGAPAGGASVIFPSDYDWYGSSNNCSASSILCGSNMTDIFDPDLFGLDFSRDFTHNDWWLTPSTRDPVNTVTGNMYHDESDIKIAGRGIDYAFTRTYNSKKSLGDADWSFPFSEGWTHSYNVRLVESEGVNFIDERGASYRYDLVNGAVFSGVQQKSKLGVSPDSSNFHLVDVLGDVDGDGYPDAIWVEQDYDSSTQSFSQVARFLKGNANGTFQSPAVVASGVESTSGQMSIIPFGDINGDSHNDFVLVMHGVPRVYLGSSSGFSLQPHSFPGANYTYGGDINGDGYKDLVRWATTGAYQGVAVYFGTVSGFDTANPQSVMADAGIYANPFDGVRTAIDVNADGYDDVVINKQDASYQRYGQIYLGSASGLSTSPATTQVFSGAMDRFPGAAFSVGDMNGDGYVDIVAAGANSSSVSGMNVYFGSASGFSATNFINIPHTDNEPATVYPLGDQNGDGYNEFGIATGSGESNSFKIYSGSGGGLLAAPVWEVLVTAPEGLLLSGSAYSYPAYDSGVDNGVLLMRDTGIKLVSLEQAILAEPDDILCEKQIAADWKGSGKYMLPFCNGTRYVFSAMETRSDEVSARLEEIVDPYGNTLAFAYDASGRLENVVDNLGLPSRTGLDFSYVSSGTATGKLETITDWSGRVWAYEYDTQGRLAAMVPPAGQDWKVTYGYVGDTHLLKTITRPEVRDGEKNIVTFDYYENGRAYRYVNGLGDQEVVDYDIYSTMSRITHPDGGVTVHDYNGSGVLEKVVNPDGGIVRFKNTVDHKRYSKKNPLGYETAYSYRSDRSISDLASDTYGLVTRERDALGNNTDYDYGLYNQVSRIVGKKGAERSYAYYEETDPVSGKIKGKLHEVRATINGQNDVLLQSFTYYAHGGIKRKIEYIDQYDNTRQRITDFTYTNNGLSVDTITVSGATDQTRYGSGAVVSIVSFEYDELGRVKSKTVSRRASAVDSTVLDLVTSYAYDEFDRITAETDPEGNISETVYDKNGKVHQVKFHHKHDDGAYTVHTQVTNYYDAYDRLIRTVDIDDGETRYVYGPTVYDGKSDLVSVTDANGNVVRHEYDYQHRRTATIDGNGRKTRFKYDSAGNLVKVINPLGHYVGYEYDPLGRQTLAVTHTGMTTEQRYDANGNVTHVLDANAYADPSARNAFGASSYREYDEFNRVVREVNAEDGETLYAYDLLGNLISLTDPESQVTQFVYDDMGLLREVVDPIVETPTDLKVSFTYDELGNRLTVTDRKGETTRFTYDILNRLTRTEYLADGVEELRTYDDQGNLLSVSNSDVTYIYTYDDKHRVTSRTDSRLGLSLAWAYDAVGNIKTKTDYQGSITTYQYDGGNRLIATVNPDYVHARYAYDGAGRALSRTLSNGARTTYTYNVMGRLETLTNIAAGGQVVGQQTFTYDLMGNIESIDDGTNTITYGYDKLYRLTGADYPGAANDLVYTYDRVGNRETISVGGSTKYYKYSAGNRLVGIYQDAAYTNPVKTYQYDANGNRTQVLDSDGTTVLQNLVFNQRGFVDAASSPAGAYAFAYDPLGYRIKREAPVETNLYMLEGEHLEAIYRTDGQVRSSYHRGSLIDEIVNGFDYSSGNKANFTVHHDHLNSVTGLTDHNGQAWQTYQYDPFGNPLSAASSQVPNDFTYTGREWDDLSGLLYYRARYYDPEIGRFISEDPLGFEAGINFYSYVDNRVLVANDPYGEDSYLVSRPLDLWPLNYFVSHNFIVTHVSEIGGGGQSFSFGDNGSDVMGRVTTETIGFSATTYQGDLDFWTSRATAGDVTRINAPDDLVASYANSILETRPYSVMPGVENFVKEVGNTFIHLANAVLPAGSEIDYLQYSVNSNSAAQAVANLSAASDVFTPDGWRTSPGSAQWNLVGSAGVEGIYYPSMNPSEPTYIYQLK